MEPAAARVDWAHDSAWRLLPLVRGAPGGVLPRVADARIEGLDSA